jgi:hypothetical protein
MKRKIVGLSKNVFHWTDKRTGEVKYAFNLFVEGRSHDTAGLKVWQLFVDNTWDIFGEISRDIDAGNQEKYLNTFCDVSYNEFGRIEEIELLPDSKPSSK